MKSLLSKGLLFSFITLLCIGVVSCKKDESKENNLIGYWFADNGSWDGDRYGLVYNFIDSSTVVSYGVTTDPEDSYEPVEGHSGWYRHSWDNYQLYYVEDNLVYIIDDDAFSILTLSGNSLIEIESNITFRRWK